jgi:hypothetical protein
MGVALTQLLLFCWYGNELTYEVTDFGGSLIYYTVRGFSASEIKRIATKI